MDVSTQSGQMLAELSRRPIRDLVESNPEVMGVLAPLGIDLCCGGIHPLGEALDLHGLDRDEVIRRVAEAIASGSFERG